MNEQNIKQSQIAGLIYGECTFWVTLVGMIVSIAGIICCFTGNNQFTKVDTLTKDLWAGKNPAHIWKTSSDPEILSGRWNLKKLSCGDGIAMLGISICCFAGVIGAWAAMAGMIINKEKPIIFQVFAIILCILLSLAASGLIYIP